MSETRIKWESLWTLNAYHECDANDNECITVEKFAIVKNGEVEYAEWEIREEYPDGWYEEPQSIHGLNYCPFCGEKLPENPFAGINAYDYKEE